MKSEILVIDDNSDIRFLICNILKDKDYLVRSAANYDQAVFEINSKLPSLAIIDIKLDKGDRDGIELLKLIMKINNKIPVIMISGHANVQLAVEAIRIGAYEFVEKPFSTEKILNYVKRALEISSLKEEKESLESKLFHSFDFIGKSPEILKIKKTIDKLSSAESRVLITGQTGTGKELVARKIHKNSTRSKFSFVVLNAALLKEKTYEKQLFGEEYDKGKVSFGILEKANKGTLLIDEVSEVPMETQASILRILIDQKFKRINGKKDINVNIRIISSSSKDLNELVAKGDFREDLFHRLSVVPINLPSLRSRTEDIPLLIDYFKKKL
jgi:two-component system nitrogen regulation response regulator NtrX